MFGETLFPIGSTVRGKKQLWGNRIHYDTGRQILFVTEVLFEKRLEFSYMFVLSGVSRL